MSIIAILKSPLFRYAALGLIILFLSKRILFLQAETKRQASNYDVLIGEKAATEQALILNLQELKKAIDKDVQLNKSIDSLNIKVKQVQSMNKTTARTQVRFKTLLKDSIVYHDSIRYEVVQRLKTFEFKDNWNDVKGVINKDSVSLKIDTKDTLVIVEYSYKKGKWFLPKLFSKRHTKTDITNSNPNAQYHIKKRIEKI